MIAAIVYENDTDFWDDRGLPPHSIEAVVYAGLDHEIARAIYRRKAAGIQTHGSTMVQIISQQSGQVYELHFTRPTGIPVWICVEQLRINLAEFPADGEDRIKAALIGYIGNEIADTRTPEGMLTIGEDLITGKLPCRVYAVPGVIDFELKVSPDGITYSYDNIDIGEREKAVTSAEIIMVQWQNVEEDEHENR